MGAFARTFLQVFLFALWALILARVIISWVDPYGRSQGARLVIQLTEPILAPVRSVLPRTGPIDFSPLIVLIVLMVVERALL